MNKKWGVLGTILAIALASIIGKFFGGMAGDEMVKQNAQTQMKESLSASEKYVDGTCTSTEYYSDFWNIRFQTTENWIMYSSEELAELNKAFKETSMSKTVENLEENNVDANNEMLEDSFEKMVNQIEMEALYYSADGVAGEGTIMVQDIMGISFEEWFNNMKNQASIGISDVTTSEQLIAGEKYRTIKAVYVADGVETVSYMFSRYKDGLVCTLNCKYVSGYESVLDSFLTQFSANN